eukprot:SAG31_NODE_649_length_13201_cov_12.359258_5_plen_79_part_00
MILSAMHSKMCGHQFALISQFFSQPKAVARYRTRYEIQMDRRIKLAFDEMDNDGSKSLDRDEIMQVSGHGLRAILTLK